MVSRSQKQAPVHAGGSLRIIDALVEGVIVYDDSGRLLDWNTAALALLGLTAEQLSSAEERPALWNVTTDEGARDLADPLEHALAIAAQSGVAMTSVRHVDGSAKLVRIRGHAGANRVSFGDATGSMFTLEEVTPAATLAQETKRSRDSVTELDASHLMFLESPAGICMVDAKGNVQRSNAAFLALTGIETGSLFAVMNADDAAIFGKAFASLADGRRKSIRIEARFAPPGRRAVWCEATTVAMRQDEEFAGILLQLNDVTERRAREARLRQLAEHDPLTGVHNRRSFVNLLEERLRMLQRADGHAGKQPVLLVLDLDGFKDVNDAWGHAVGDSVLEAVATGIRARTRLADMVARLGGDEFALLFELRDGGAEAMAIAEDVVRRIERAAHGVIDQPRISASIGLVRLHAALGADEALALADRAMYAAKRAGKGHAIDAATLERSAPGSRSRKSKLPERRRS